MAAIMMCEPQELYNLLNQSSRVSRLAEINYLCLVDARETQDYKVSHIITAKHAKTDSKSSFFLPDIVEVDSMQHVVIYDSNTSCSQEQGRAVQCAQALAKVSLYPVHIVTGGFQRFSALYPFLRTEKIIYTIMEAWRYMLKCKPNMRPNTGFLEQLSDWELHTRGTKVTDISEPHF
ncbi:serine/threonine/tyrosine-interacting-like protein 1 [Scomber scombrus]|uniref:serine/threonine/tyrosine-interacting-like protein 1 n=1 Tax=Scomber scombrus TaxID=13677 RepID=UPI002DD96322|nr:serine/threonine/tyrosine-interacting-like protein 1 [Scomber scombrus]